MSIENLSPETMDLRSADISAENRAKLKQLFPAVFVETVNGAGELVEGIDFEKLKAELGTFSDVFEAHRARYGMDWPGKKAALKLIQEPSVGTLKPCREESVNFDDTENLFIEGDNLEVLKLLQKSYYGKVKMIYIDPPYNTGKEFIYPDKYAESLDTYLAYAGLVDDEGKKFSTNTPNEGRFHTKWLNMMYPRLYLARNLLSDDGIIFVSIDDHEVHNLRALLNEILGEENFIAELVWEKGRKNDAKLFSVGHEYMLVYGRSLNTLKENATVWREIKPGAQAIWNKYLELREKHGQNYEVMEQELRAWYKQADSAAKSLSRYKHIDQHGPWRDRDISWPGGGGPRYDVIHPKTGQPCKVPDRGWGFSSKEAMDKQVKLGLVVFRGDHTEPPFRKAHLRPLAGELDEDIDALDMETEEESVSMGMQVMPSVLYKQSQSAVKHLRKLMEAKIFDNPKDHEVLARLINYCTAKSEIILDFFSGSCSAAEAVIRLNQGQKIDRKFIMVQLPEPCDENSEAFKAGYKTIADIGKERIRRVIGKIEAEQAAKADKAKDALPGTIEEPAKLDIGFKVLKLDRSNFKIWEALSPDAAPEAIADQLEMHVEHIDPSASPEDILYELLLKAGFMPTKPVEKPALAGKQVFSVAEGALLICLEDEITRELIDAVAATQPLQFICLDRGFKGNDQLKANAVQTFAALNQGKDRADRIVFRTV